MAVILRYFSEFGSFGTHCAQQVEDILKLSATEMYPKRLVLSDVSLPVI